MDLCVAYNQAKSRKLNSIILQACQNLQGVSKDPLLLSGEYFDEQKELEELKSQNLATLVSLVFHLKYFLAVLLNDNMHANFIFTSTLKSLPDHTFPFISLNQPFFIGLVSAALARKSKGRARRRYIADARRGIGRLKDRLIHCPDNVISKIYLIEAELEFCKGRFSTALLHYRRSIGYAEKAGFISEHGLACEKGGIMLQHAGRLPEANHLLMQARSLYELWGAKIKVEQVDQLLAQKAGAH